MISKMINLWPFTKKEDPPKYRLKPDARGTYSLEKWCELVGYSMIEVQLTPEGADKAIANLEREVKYYREEVR